MMCRLVTGQEMRSAAVSLSTWCTSPTAARAGSFALFQCRNTFDSFTWSDKALHNSSIAQLSNSRYYARAAGFGKLAFFAAAAKLVDIFDVEHGWRTAWPLSVERSFMNAIASSNGVIFFAGGYDHSKRSERSEVDMYDGNTGNYAGLTYLSVARYSVASAAVGDFVYFAGGTISHQTWLSAVATIDTWNVKSKSWEPVMELSVARLSLAGCTAGLSVLFGGGAGDSTIRRVYDIIGTSLYRGLPLKIFLYRCI